jgi:hypothetical protein
MSESGLPKFEKLTKKYLYPIEGLDGRLVFTGHEAAEAVDEIVVLMNDERLEDLESPYTNAFHIGLSGKVSEVLKSKRKVHCITSHLSKEVIETVVRDLPGFEFWFYILSPAAIGSNIDQYRDLVRNAILRFDLDGQKRAVRDIARALTENEIMSLGKIYERVIKDPGNIDFIENYPQIRFQKWTEQVQHALGLKP